MNLVGDRWFPTLANSFALILRKEIVTPTLIKYKDLESFSTISPGFWNCSCMQQTKLIIYTDGACKGNPEWRLGAILIYGDKTKEIYGYEPRNN